jgi:16S rRNA processing protein RimM
MVEGFYVAAGEPLHRSSNGSPPNENVGRINLPDRIALAAIAGAHGIHGELRLKLFADSAESLARHATVFVGEREVRLQSVKDSGKTAIARLAGVNGRSAAEALRGSLIEVDRAALPPLEDGEYYHADLIGLPCVSQDGAPLGAVVAVENFGAGDLLEVEDREGRRSLIPFRPGVADLEGERIVLDPEFLA